MSILSIENLSYTYPGGQKAVLRDVNAAFEPGKMYAITGPSGSGKSTLLSLLAGMETPTEGAIVCEGESLADLDLDAYRREKIAFVFQAYQLLPLLTARENVCLPMEMQGAPTAEASERADALLLSVGLPDTLHKRFPGNLSGGEQQRVGIARSLASGAKVILADEPTGNLDDENTTAIMALLRKQVIDNGYCVIIVTHDPEVAAACDVCYQMRGGTLIENSKDCNLQQITHRAGHKMQSQNERGRMSCQIRNEKNTGSRVRCAKEKREQGSMRTPHW